MAQGKPWLEYWSRNYTNANGQVRTKTVFRVAEGYIVSDDSSVFDSNLAQYLLTGKPLHYDKFENEAWTKHCVWNKDKNNYDIFIWDDNKKAWKQVFMNI